MFFGGDDSDAGVLFFENGVRQGFYGGDSGLENGGFDEFKGAVSDVFIFHDKPGVEGVGFCFLRVEGTGGFKECGFHGFCSYISNGCFRGK